MSKEQRQEEAAAIAEQVGKAKVVYVTDFSGLSVLRMTEFRRRLRAAGASYVVVKNTLAKRALGQRILHDDVGHPGRAQPASELGHPEHVQPGEIGDVQSGRRLEPPGQRIHRFLPFGLAHRYTAVSIRTPGPMVLETVADRM